MPHKMVGGPRGECSGVGISCTFSMSLRQTAGRLNQWEYPGFSRKISGRFGANSMKIIHETSCLSEDHDQPFRVSSALPPRSQLRADADVITWSNGIT